MSVISTGPSGALVVKGLTDVIGIGGSVNSNGSLNSRLGPSVRRVTGDPNGVVTDFGGSLAMDVNSGVVYFNKATANAQGSSWSLVASAPVTGTAAGVRLFGLTAAEAAFGAGTSGTQLFTNGQVTIPANTLSGGSLIKVRLGGQLNQGAAATVAFGLRIGSAPTTPIVSTAQAFGNVQTVVDFSFTVRGAGASVLTSGSLIGAVGGATFTAVSPSGANLNTTVNNTLSLTVNFSAANVGTSIDIIDYEVVLFP